MVRFIVVLISLLLIVSCASDDSLNLADINSPTTVNSVDNLPKPTLSNNDIAKRGAIIVIGESASGQSQYNALTSARGVAQKNLLSIVNGVKINADAIINKGELTKDDVNLIVNGHIRSLDCGAYFDRTHGIGYYCVQMVLKKKY